LAKEFNVWDAIKAGAVRYDGRVSIAIFWFKDEADADRYGDSVRKSGSTYNGGYFHGKPCGRERERDYTDKDGVRWYAVTD